MIRFATPMPSGNAANLLLQTPASKWALLRRNDSAFTGYPDAGAAVVASGYGTSRDDSPWYPVVDYSGLVNGTPVWYQLYMHNGAAWVADGISWSITPGYDSQLDVTLVDPVELIRDRLEAGLNSELALNFLTHQTGRFPVLRSPPIIDDAVLPVVTVLLQHWGSEVRGIGESVIPDWFNPDADVWECYEGFLGRSEVQIAAWSLNATERAKLRQAVSRVLTLNLPVFDAAGLDLIDISSTDLFDPVSYGVPVYQSVFSFSCLHPTLVKDRVDPIRHLEVYPDGEKPQ